MDINNVTTEQRKEIHQIIANRGGCNIANDDFDSGDFDLDMAMLMDDMLSEMAENASHKDDEGYSFSTNTDMPEYRYEQLLQLAEANKQFKFKNTRRDGTKGHSIYVNCDLGDTSNCWAFGCDIGEYNPQWLNHEQDVHEYEHLWKDRIRSKWDANKHLMDNVTDGIVAALTQTRLMNEQSMMSFDSFVEIRENILEDVLSGTKFHNMDACHIPMFGLLKGINGPVKFYASYSIADICVDDDGTVMAILILNDRQYANLDDGCSLPEQVVVPTDYLAYTYKDDWVDYVCQDLTK